MCVCFIIYFWLFMVVFLGVCGIAFWLISFLGFEFERCSAVSVVQKVPFARAIENDSAVRSAAF